MFTGIITDQGHVRSVSVTGSGAGNGEGRRFEIETHYILDSIAIGASIACDGACMTVVEKNQNTFCIETSAESLSKTTMGDWKPGTAINLERPLCLGDELGGHMVSGHVDGVGTLIGRIPDGDSLCLTFVVPPNLAKFIVSKGSITLDGVSLTVNDVQDDQSVQGQTSFNVNIIPHTQTATTLGALSHGDKVNVEIDMLARYVARLLAHDEYVSRNTP